MKILNFKRVVEALNGIRQEIATSNSLRIEAHALNVWHYNNSMRYFNAMINKAIAGTESKATKESLQKEFDAITERKDG